MKTNPIKTNIQHRLPKKPGESRKSGWGEVRAWVPGVSAVLLIGMVVREVQKRKQLNQERERYAVQEAHRLTENQERERILQTARVEQEAKRARQAAKHQRERDRQYKQQLQKEQREQQNRLNQIIEQILGPEHLEHLEQQEQPEQEEAEYQQQKIERCNKTVCKKEKCSKDEFKKKYKELMKIFHPDKGGNEEIAKYLNECNDIINPKPTHN